MAAFTGAQFLAMNSQNLLNTGEYLAVAKYFGITTKEPENFKICLIRAKMPARFVYMAAFRKPNS